jgi:hypothetical protein
MNVEFADRQERLARAHLGGAELTSRETKVDLGGVELDLLPRRTLFMEDRLCVDADQPAFTIGDHAPALFTQPPNIVLEATSLGP